MGHFFHTSPWKDTLWVPICSLRQFSKTSLMSPQHTFFFFFFFQKNEITTVNVQKFHTPKCLTKLHNLCKQCKPRSDCS